MILLTLIDQRGDKTERPSRSGWLMGIALISTTEDVERLALLAAQRHY